MMEKDYLNSIIRRNDLGVVSRYLHTTWKRRCASFFQIITMQKKFGSHERQDLHCKFCSKENDDRHASSEGEGWVNLIKMGRDEKMI